ncbi:uncharacterized protein LOC116805879 [Drosophila grimshawi]|nr:uncharacterized protein LOC116805879 [Drosophila grimshawi]
MWFFSLKSVRYAQISLVVLGDLLSLASIYPSHSLHIWHPFLTWRR